MRSSAWHYWVYWTAVLCAVAAALVAFGVIRWPGKQTLTATNGFAPIYAAQSGKSGLFSEPNLLQRRLYPYSVIPGGVESAQELRNAIANDPLVARLYANFDLSRAHVVRLSKDQEVYVSYRLGGRIFWTKKRLLLRTGETVLTDGTHEARTRCGNRVSETPMQPVAPNEPPNVAVSPPLQSTTLADNVGDPPLLAYVPPVSPTPDPGQPLLPQPPSAPPVIVIPPPIFPIVGGGPPSFPSVIPPPPSPPVSTPEPGAGWLLGIGLIVFATAMGISKVRKHPTV